MQNLEEWNQTPHYIDYAYSLGLSSQTKDTKSFLFHMHMCIWNKVDLVPLAYMWLCSTLGLHVAM